MDIVLTLAPLVQALTWIIHEPSLESAGGRRTRRRKENALTTLVTNVNSYVVYTAVEQKNSRS